MILIDTNILVYAHRAGVPQHARARAAIQKAADAHGCGVALPSVAEFWSVVTHPAAPPAPSSARVATAFLVALQAAGVQIWAPGSGFAARLCGLAESRAVAGARVFDLQIALCGFDNGATEIWSHDASFLAPLGMRVVDPL